MTGLRTVSTVFACMAPLIINFMDIVGDVLIIKDRGLAHGYGKLDKFTDFMVKIAVEKLGDIAFAATKILGKLGAVHMVLLHERNQLSVEIGLEFGYPIAFTS